MKKKLFSLILALVFIITSIPMNFAVAQEYPTEGITKEFIYFRQSPKNATTPRVKGCETINKGEKVTVLCESDGFYLLKYKGYYGFARMSDIQIGQIANTPTPTKKPTVAPAKTPTPTHQAGLVFYSDVYSGATKEKVYFRVKPTSATTERVSGCETIAASKEVYVLGIIGDFYYISYNGYYGYARTQDIRVYGKAQSTPMPTVTVASTPKPTQAPQAPTTGGNESSLQYYGDKYNGKTKEKVYFRVNPASATTPRVKGCETIAANKEVVVHGINGNFYYISYKGYYGYARTQDIRILGKVTATVTPTPTPTPISPAFYADKYVGTTLEKVYFRAKPTSATTPRVSGCETIGANKEVMVLGEYGEFYYISYNGYYGYARKQDVRIYGKYVPPTPTPKPTSNPTSAPIPSNVRLTSEQTQKWNSVASKLISQSAKNRDAKGWIYIPTTKNINYPIMYDSKFYYDDHTPEKKSSTRGSIYLYNEMINNINIVAGHNSRESQTMFHELHHIQAKLMGRKTCESCGSNVSYIDTQNLVFHVMYGGYSVCQLFAMYETKANENEAVLKYNTTHPTLSGNSRKSWINYQLSRSQKDFGVSVGDKDKILVLLTCGDNYDSSTAQSRLYMFLKAVY